MERGISDEKGEFGKQKQEKLCKIWGINDDETNCILTKLKRHKIIKKLSKSVDKRGCTWYYSQALERDGKKLKAKSLKGKPLEREHRTLKIKQREKEWNL